MGGEVYRYPQGRNVTQYQLVDDVSWTKGKHGLKFGVNFRRVDWADYGIAAAITTAISESAASPTSRTVFLPARAAVCCGSSFR